MRVYLSVLATVFLASACVDSSSKQRIHFDGSSTVFPITEAVLSNYSNEHDIQGFSGKASGTKAGLRKLCEGEIEIANASRPINEEEQALCERNDISLLEIEIAKDGIAIVVNSENDWVDYFSVNELRKFWELSAEDNVIKWGDIRPEWPDENIYLFGPSSNSGTYDFFFDIVLGDGVPPRGDYVASENDSFLGRSIAENKYATGFFGLAYYKEVLFSLKLVPVDDEISANGDDPVSPSEMTVKNGRYTPLSRVLYLYISELALQNSKVINFLEYYLLHASELVREVGYVDMPQDVYTSQLQLLQTYKNGK